MMGQPRPHPIGYVLAVAVGLTWASNAIGGGTILLNLAVAVAASAYGWSSATTSQAHSWSATSQP